MAEVLADTSRQPNRYLERLPQDTPASLPFVAPAARPYSLWHKAEGLLRVGDDDGLVVHLGERAAYVQQRLRVLVADEDGGRPSRPSGSPAAGSEWRSVATVAAAGKPAEQARHLLRGYAPPCVDNGKGNVAVLENRGQPDRE